MDRLTRSEAAGTGGGREVLETVSVAGWTLVSRVTGLARVAVVGATLGPTFFANIFQATNTVPNITYNLMAGSLLTPLIVPSLVEALDIHGVDRARRVAQGLIGAVITGFCAAGLVVLALGPLIVHLLTLGVHNRGDASRAAHQSWVLLLLVVPQIVFYGVAAVGIAAQNARRHFALAAAAPAVENIGLIATLLVAAKLYGVGLPIAEVTPGYLVVLGAGATLSVAAHAGLQLFGAARAGLPLWPRWGWSDPAVRKLCRRAVPTIGTAIFDAGWLFALIVAAGTIPGGVVAFQIGLNFYYLPVALSAKAVGTVLLPRLARETVQEDLRAFRRTYDRGLSRIWFVAAPASVSLLFLASPISKAIAFGEMHRANGVHLVAAAIASLGIALIGASTNEFARQACYARRDVVAPLQGGAALVVVTLVTIPFALTAFHGAAALAALGVVVTVGELTRSMFVNRAALRGAPTERGSLRPLVRHLMVALATVGPLALVARMVDHDLGGRVGALTALALGVGGGLVAYVALQAVVRAPEAPASVLSSPRWVSIAAREKSGR